MIDYVEIVSRAEAISHRTHENLRKAERNIKFALILTAVNIVLVVYQIWRWW